MRPKLLEIEGLQSFRDIQRIDFESLGETGLFGIFGPTGSGKSTVLDAVTFALYGKVKRADRGTQGIINTNRENARVSFTFEILKDGERKTYRVERNYRRKKNTENSCEPKVVRLVEVTGLGDMPICDKASEITAGIEKLIGLGHDDFTRAVVLPQNSFQEFLMLDNSKKREMLERIFYLEEYGRELSDKVWGKIYSLKSSLDAAGGKLSGYEDADDGNLVIFNERMLKVGKEREAAEKSFERYEKKYNEAKEVWLLVNDKKLLEEKIKKHDEVKEEYDVKKTKLEKTRRAEGLADIIKKTDILTKKLADTSKELEKAAVRIPEVLSELGSVGEKHENIKSEYIIEQPKLIEKRARLTEAAKIKINLREIAEKTDGINNELGSMEKELDIKQAQMGEITADAKRTTLELEVKEEELKKLYIEPGYRSALNEASKLENDIETLVQRKKETEKKLLRQQGLLKDVEEKITENEASIKNSKGELLSVDEKTANHLKTVPADRKAVYEHREKINTIKHTVDDIFDKNTGIQKLKAKAEMIYEALDAIEKKIEKAFKAKEKCEEKCVELGSLVEEWEKNTAYVLATKLVKGEPCPVCGSSEHPRPAVFDGCQSEDDREQNPDAIKKNLKRYELELAEHEKKLVQLSEQKISQQEQVKQLEDEIFTISSDISELRSKLPEKSKELEPEMLEAHIAGMFKEADVMLEEIEEWEKARDGFFAHQQKLKEEIGQLEISAGKYSVEKRSIVQNISELGSEVNGYDGLISEKDKLYSDYKNKYDFGSASVEIKRLLKSDRMSEKINKELDKLKRSLKILEDKKEKLSGKISVEKEEISSKKNIYDNLVTKKNDEEKKIKELTQGNDIQEELEDIEKKLSSYIEIEKLYSQKLKALEEEKNKLESEKNKLQNQYAIFLEDSRKEEEQLIKAMEQKGFLTKEEVLDSIIPPDLVKLYEQEIEEYEQKTINFRAQMELTDKKLSSRDISETEWKDAENNFSEAKRHKEECVASDNIAKSEYIKLKDRNIKWKELKNEYDRMDKKFALYDQIQKLLKAEKGKDNSFIDYIAEERLRYVAAKASQTLGKMTGYKYELELDTNSGFIIRDNANGGVHRTVSSLSGGETFLTSLSLALALSEQIQLKGQSPLEFFFLDEGFGTLDNELLDTVMDSLEKLSSQERVIGLISHVPELKSRITRRLVVDPPTLKGEGSRIRIEKG